MHRFTILAMVAAACSGGPQSAVGPRGEAGIQGPVGPAGAKGDTGAQGAAGTAGLMGETGATGQQGLMGVAGAQGGGKYTTRQDVYCRTASNPAIVGRNASIEAQCDSIDDLGLIGHCFGVDPFDDNVRLFLAYPTFEASAQPARFSCYWGYREGADAGALPQATARVCCIHH